MDRGIQLTFNLLLTLVVKLPIVAFFFKRKKRQPAVTVAVVINLITWIVGTLLWLKNPDVNQFFLRIGISVAEAIAYWFFLGRNWKKAILIAIVTNIAIYVAAKFIVLPEGFFQKKDNIIR